MLECRSVSVSYAVGPSRLHVLSDLDWRLEGGSAHAVMGPSGSGKTTLLRVLSGIQRPDTGEVRLGGRGLEYSGAVASGVSVVHQDYPLVEFLTVEENLRLAADLRGVAVVGEDVESALGRVGMEDSQTRFPKELSGGQQQRVAIARALLTKSRAVLADEPTGALDAKNTAMVARLLKSLAVEDGVTVVVASHDRSVADIMGQVVELSGGQLQERQPS